MRYLFIIGAMKSGTTSLFDSLCMHPLVNGARLKESGFFAFEERFHLGSEWYDGLFASRPGIKLDATTDYAKYPFCKDVLARMEQYCGNDFKIIYLLRHPLERIESHARHTHKTKKEVGQCSSPITDFSFDNFISPVNLYTSMYATQIHQYEKIFDKERFLPILLEEVLSNPDRSMMKIFEFIGLDFEKKYGALSHSNRADKKNKLNFREKLERLIEKPKLVEPRFLLNSFEKEIIISKLGPELDRLISSYGIKWSHLWTDLT